LDWQASDLRLEEAGCCINHYNHVFKNYRRKSWKENFLQSWEMVNCEEMATAIGTIPVMM